MVFVATVKKCLCNPEEIHWVTKEKDSKSEGLIQKERRLNASERGTREDNLCVCVNII